MLYKVVIVVIILVLLFIIGMIVLGHYSETHGVDVRVTLKDPNKTPFKEFVSGNSADKKIYTNDHTLGKLYETKLGDDSVTHDKVMYVKMHADESNYPNPLKQTDLQRFFMERGTGMNVTIAPVGSLVIQPGTRPNYTVNTYDKGSDVPESTFGYKDGVSFSHTRGRTSTYTQNADGSFVTVYGDGSKQVVDANGKRTHYYIDSITGELVARDMSEADKALQVITDSGAGATGVTTNVATAVNADAETIVDVSGDNIVSEVGVAETAEDDVIHEIDPSDVYTGEDGPVVLEDTVDTVDPGVDPVTDPGTDPGTGAGSDPSIEAEAAAGTKEGFYVDVNKNIIYKRCHRTPSKLARYGIFKRKSGVIGHGYFEVVPYARPSRYWEPPVRVRQKISGTWGPHTYNGSIVTQEYSPAYNPAYNITTNEFLAESLNRMDPIVAYGVKEQIEYDIPKKYFLT